MVGFLFRWTRLYSLSTLGGIFGWRERIFSFSHSGVFPPLLTLAARVLAHRHVCI